MKGLLVVLSEDPTETATDKIKDIEVIQTMINGKIVVDSKNVLGHL